LPESFLLEVVADFAEQGVANVSGTGTVKICLFGSCHEWRCPSEFCVFATENCHDRAALKNAILRVREFQDFFPRAGMTLMA
jgi:hypothetical protein